MSTIQYFLPHDVFFCLSEPYWVFLDLRSDRYLCTARDVLAPPSTCARPYPPHDGLAEQYATPTTADAAQELVRAGLISATQEGCKELVPTELAPPSSSLAKTSGSAGQQLLVQATWRFLLASARADIQLRHRTLAQVVHGVRQHRSRTIANRPAGKPLVSTLVAIFNRIRPLYPRNYLCLFDSLAMLEFLSGYHVYPRWIFGVRVEPFEAHCWLQDKDSVLNDTVERVGTFAPIMIV